jgi:hypothetical protein
VAGGVGAGKSVLADYLGADFTARYPKSHRLILDSKPRYRAAETINGTSAKRRYRSWGHGQPVLGSVLVESPEHLRLAWDMGWRVAIVQGDGEAERPRMLDVVQEFYKQANARVPQLLQVDELIDWVGQTGMTKYGSDVVVRSARAGRERGLGCLFCSQRTRAIPATILEEMNRLFLFRIDYSADVKRLAEMGAPVDVEDMPTEEFHFKFWTKKDYDHLYGPFKLDLASA